MKIKSPLMFVIILSLSTRLLFFLMVQPWDNKVQEKVILQSDALGYNQLACSLNNYGSFTYKKGGPPDGLRTPLYPAFIYFIYSIFGQKPWIVMIFQIILDTISCALLFLMLKEFSNSRIALYSSSFYSFDPFLILFSTSLFSDILFCFLIILASWIFSKFILCGFDKLSKKRIILSAVFFGLAALARPIAQFIPIGVTIILLLLYKNELMKAFKYITLFIFVFLLILSSWLVRNYLTFNSLSLSYAGDVTFLQYFIIPMKVEREGRSREIIGKELSVEAEKMMIQDGFTPNELNDFQKSKYYKKVGIYYVTKYPLLFGKLYAFGIVHSFYNLGTGEFSNMLRIQKKQNNFDFRDYPNFIDQVKQWFKQKNFSEQAIGISIGIFLTACYTLLIIGFWRSWRNRGNPFVIFCVIMTLYFILISGTAGLARYRLPAIPFYLYFVGLGASYLVERIKHKLNIVNDSVKHFKS